MRLSDSPFVVVPIDRLCAKRALIGSPTPAVILVEFGHSSTLVSGEKDATAMLAASLLGAAGSLIRHQHAVGTEEVLDIV